MLGKITNIYKQLSRRTRTFLKAFSITVAASFAVVIGAIIAWNLAVTPPAQREVHAAPPPSTINRSPGSSSGYWTPPPSTNTENEIEEDEPIGPLYNAPYWAEDRREYFWTFLIIGLNERNNANTVAVASYCGITREAQLVNIPRDVPVHPTRNGRKISSSYIVGTRNGGGRAGGVATMQRDVQTVIGFVPDFYIVIDYDTFFTIIDTVGGIEVYVPIRMRYDDPYQNLFIDIQPGLQHMDSRTALHFSRFRQSNRDSGFPNMPGGDLGRIENQQAVISAVISRLLRPENLNPVRINEFINIFNDSVYSNLSFTDMLYFANELNHVSRTGTVTDALTAHTFPTRHGSYNRVSYQFLTATEVVALVNSTVNPFDGDITLGDIRIIGQ